MLEKIDKIVIIVMQVCIIVISITGTVWLIKSMQLISLWGL